MMVTGRWIIILISLKSSFCEWVLIPSISSKQNEIIKEQPITEKFHINLKALKNVSTGAENMCPDFHNLTMLSYGNEQQPSIHSSNGWEISLADINDMIEQNKKIPKKSVERFNFLQNIKERLMSEAETKLKNLFGAGSREARTKYIHSPSMESALLTISMLLFGVYLTKLMLKLLQSHYSKYNSNMGMINGIRAPIIIAQTRRTRSSPTDLKELNIMHIIDKYESRFN